MTAKQKVIGIVLLVGLPLLLILTAPSSKGSIDTKPAANTTDTQPLSDHSSPDTTASVSHGSNNPQDISGAVTQPQTPAQQYNYTPASPTIPTSRPVTPLAAPTSAPSVWTNTTGFLTGTYHYLVTYLSATGQETSAGPTSLAISPSNQRVWLTSIPTSPDNSISERNLYRTLANSTTMGPYYLVTSFYDNLTTSYYDNIPDNVLSTESPKYF